MKKGNAIGFLLVFIGSVFLLKQLGVINFTFNPADIFVYFWPMFLIIPGLSFHMSYFSNNGRDAGLLVPGGILLGCGVTCQLGMLYNMWDIVWPGFIFSVALGLFELYIFGKREKGLLIPVFILGGLSIVFFSMTIMSWMMQSSLKQIGVSIVIIVLGIFFMIRRK